MPPRKVNPTSAGRRNMTMPDFSDITTNTPEKSLLLPMKGRGGRNNQGRLTVRHKGGGHKRNLQNHRFQTQQVQRSGCRQVSRIRSEP